MKLTRVGTVTLLSALAVASACHRSQPSPPRGSNTAPQPPATPATTAPAAPAHPIPQVVGCIPEDDGAVAWRDDGRAFVVSPPADGGTGQSGDVVSGVDHVAEVVSDGIRRCARTSAGGVFCWGHYLGALAGSGADDSTPRPTPIAIPGIVDATQMALGSMRACVIRADHTLWCWGDLGPLGGPGTARPQAMPGFENAAQVAMAEGAACIRTSAGTVVCAGSYDYGLLGIAPPTNDHGESPSLAHPTTIAGLSGVAEIAMSRIQACARLNDGTVKCWGAGFGATPVTVRGVTGATAIALGDSLNQVDGGTEGSPSVYEAHAVGCAWSADGHATCWNADADHFTEGTLDPMQAGEARRVADLDGATHVSFGQSTDHPHACGTSSNAPLRAFVFNGPQLTTRVLPVPAWGG